jgi:hypothetical protein
VRETRSVTFIIRMRPTVKAAGERAADVSNRSLSSLMETLLIDHLKSAGFWPPPDEEPAAKPTAKGKKK